MDKQEAVRLGAELFDSDELQRANAARTLAKEYTAVTSDIDVFVHDSIWGFPIQVRQDVLEASGLDARNNLPTATLKLKGSSGVVDTLMGCRNTMVGVRVEIGGMRQAFYVKSHGWEFEKGAWTSTSELRGIWEILNYLQVWPIWWLPLAIQPLSHAIFVGPLVTIIENMICECVVRLRSGLLQFLNNITSFNFDIRTWFSIMLETGSIFGMLRSPIYVKRTNPWTDGSPWYVRLVRMESCAAVIQDITRSTGIDVRVDLWLPGDPQPDPWSYLGVPTYVVTVVDKSQISGPTGTLLDGFVRTVVDAQGALGNFLGPYIDPANTSALAPEGTFVAPALGVNFSVPYTILRMPKPTDPNPGSPVVSCKIYDNTPMGWQHVIGGRSPRWLNNLINLTLSWIIDSLMIIIGIAGIPGDFLSGFMNDSFLAFQMLEMYDRRKAVGPYHPAMETFTPTHSAPYNLEALFTFINKAWETRGYTSAQVVIRHSPAFALGRDVARGGLMSIVYETPGGATKIYTDYITQIVWKISPTERDVFMQLGDGRGQEPPFAKHQRLITGLQELINVVTVTPRQ